MKIPEDNSLNYSLKQLEAFADGDPQSAQMILMAFMKSSIQNLELFKQYLADKDYTLLAELSHKMLPMFRQLETNTIIRLLESLELKNMEKLSSESRKLVGETVSSKIELLLDKIRYENQLPIIN